MEREPAKVIVAGTGHRPGKLGGYGDDVAVRLQDVAEQWLFGNAVTRVISGMALGWDQALARAALNLRIPLHAAVPFAGQERIWLARSQAEYRRILDAADEVTFVSQGDYAPHKMQVRNKFMVDRCDTVLALWDGSSGGTSNCVSYANKARKPVVNLWWQFSPEKFPWL